MTTLPPSCAIVMKSGNLNFLEPSGPLQACNGTALPLLYVISEWKYAQYTRFTVSLLCGKKRDGIVIHVALR